MQDNSYAHDPVVLAFKSSLQVEKSKVGHQLL